MSVNLLEEIAQIPDPRSRSGRRHSLWLVLLLVILGVLSGCQGYRALGDFVSRHREALIERLDVPKSRLPSYSTLRRVMMVVDFTQLASVFNRWAQSSMGWDNHQWLAIDGKSLKGTLQDPNSSFQNFVSLVSCFSIDQGIAIHLAQLENKHGSEIATVQMLLEALDLSGVTFTLDSLHCQKKLSS